MGGASWAPIRICSSSTSTTNSPNKNRGKRRTRSRREGERERGREGERERGSWALGRSPEGARTQADFVVNIIQLIGRIVKRNLRLLAAFLWNSGCTLQGLRPSGGVLPAGAGGVSSRKWNWAAFCRDAGGLLGWSPGHVRDAFLRMPIFLLCIFQSWG